jgi:hypothetical protein
LLPPGTDFVPTIIWDAQTVPAGLDNDLACAFPGLNAAAGFLPFTFNGRYYFHAYKYSNIDLSQNDRSAFFLRHFYSCGGV